ncbi:MAG TPA: LPS-assembly protein LptD [Methylococcaceae bacterium]|nr:LPS-assembly protein LptD [Methylococcaceae bacterium]
MHCRITLLFFLLVSSTCSQAYEPAWDCEQDGSGEWVCGADEPIAKSSKPVMVSESTEAADSPVVTQKNVPSLGRVANNPQEAQEANEQNQPPQDIIQLEPPRKIARAAGWDCAAGEGDETWNCSLTGTDPKGKPRVMPDERRSFSLLSPAFDHEQELNFDIMHSQLPYDPWENCTTSLGAPPGFLSTKDLRDETPMDIRADYSEIFDNEITGFFGNVDIVRADQRMAADTMHYDTVSQTLDAQGHVYYSEDALSLYSDTMMLKLASDEARLRNTLFISPTTPLRGSARTVYRDSKVLSRYNEVAFTSCKPGNTDWVLHASDLKLNKESGEGSAKHAWLEFKGVPIIYTPYISFPLDDRRKSGFLAPNLSVNNRNGYDVALPYYWNIAPNYDLTFRPRYMTSRGMQWGGDFRHLSEMTDSRLQFEVLPDDQIRNKTRYLAGIQNTTTFLPNLISTVDASYVSDDDYFDDMGNSITINDTRFLRSHADIRYSMPGVSFFSQLENYQTTDRTIPKEDQPYRRLPQARLDLNHSFDFMPLDVSMGSEYVYFQQDQRVSGQRFNIEPAVAVPLEAAGVYLTPKLSLKHTQYILENQEAGRPRPDSISRTLPIFSADTGFTLEREFGAGESSYLHTIEPRLFYLYIPYKDQRDIPLFDTGEYDYNFYSLFRENRFSGSDRVQDANQVTTALTNRIIDPRTGRENMRLTIGEIFYFRDRLVQLDDPRGNFDSFGNPRLVNQQSPTNSFANLIAEFSAQLTEHLSLRTAGQWDHAQNDLTRGEVALRYTNRPEQLVNLGYRFRQDLTEVTDVSFRWPIYDNWYAVGRWQYSMLFDRTVESFAGFEKESCCWRFRIIGRRYINSINVFAGQEPTGEAQTGVFVQLELKGLTAFGDRLDEFFERNIYGYVRPQ